MSAAFLLIASPTESREGERLSAETMARRRIASGAWGLYTNTPHKAEMKSGDTLIMYLAGSGGMRFFASALAGTITFKPRAYQGDGDALTDPPAAVLSLVSPWIFPESIPMSRVKDRLKFVPQGTRKWGCVMQRGAKRISAEDASLILSEAKAERMDCTYPSSVLT